MREIFPSDTYKRANVTFTDHVNWIDSYLKNGKCIDDMPDVIALVGYLFGNDEVELPEVLPPVFSDVARFIYALVNTLPDDLSPIAKFLRNNPWKPSIGESKPPSYFYQEIVPSDNLLIHAMGMFVTEYFYHVNTFTQESRIQYADIIQLGNDVHNRKCDVFGWGSSTIIFPNKVSVDFPFMPCVFNLGLTSHDPNEFTNLKIDNFNRRLQKDGVECAAVMLPTILSPCFGVPLTLLMKEISSQIPGKHVLPTIDFHPDIYSQKQFNSLLSSGKLVIWEKSLQKEQELEQDPLLSIPFDSLPMQ